MIEQSAMKIEFRLITEKDFSTIYIWENSEHVLQWYGKLPLSQDEINHKYGGYLSSDNPDTGYIIVIDSIEVGFIQTYYYRDFPSDEYNNLLEADEHSAGLDIYIGNKDFIHKGYGSHIVSAFLNEYIFANPRTQNCIITPEPENIAAIKTYEKSGFKWYKTILTPETKGHEFLMICKNSRRII